MSNDPSIDRRRFFRHGLRELLKPLASGLDSVERLTGELANLDSPRSGRKVPLQLCLRPPGALHEEEFRATCCRSGQCVSVCPAHAIKIDSTGKKGGGAPY